MKVLRRSHDRGYADNGWLKSFHTFSFADYYDANFMGFSVLRVINEDDILPNSGFPMHPHRDMEIVTYVYEGTLEHKDSLGNVGQIRHGEIQRMSAGSGIRHSEYNPSTTEKCKLLQIWLLPDQAGHNPSYEQVNLKDKFQISNWVLIASNDGKNGSTKFNQNANLYAAQFKSGDKFDLPIAKDRKGWLQMIEGEVEIFGEKLGSGDAIAIWDESSVQLNILKKAHFIYFDLP